MLEEIESGHSDLIVVNYANGDMVGHTGVLNAAIAAVEAVDDCVGRVVEATLAKGGSLVVTADHGNCEQMIDPETGGPHTAHTTYDVPLIIVEPGLEGQSLRAGGRLADIAPTNDGKLHLRIGNFISIQFLIFRDSSDDLVQQYRSIAIARHTRD